MLLRPTIIGCSLLLAPGCGGEPGAPPDTQEPRACAEGYHADGDACMPEACGVGTWGDLPVDEASIYVDASADEGGDGSEGAPLRAIQPALDLAAERGGGLVAVAAGTYPEKPELHYQHAGIRLAGRCRDLVVIDASGEPSGQSGIFLDTRYGSAEISGISVVGASMTGIGLGTGNVRLVDVRVADSSDLGIEVYRGLPPAVAQLTLEGCVIERNRVAGLVASDPGTTLTVRETVVRDSRPGEQGRYGYGVLAYNGAAVLFERSELLGNTNAGVAAVDPGTTISMVDSVVEHTRVGGDGLFGIGVYVEADAELHVEDSRVSGSATTGILVQDGASLTMVGSDLSENVQLGLWVAGQDSWGRVSDSVIRDTRTSDESGVGYGVDAGRGASLTLERCEVARNGVVGAGAWGEGTSLTLVDTQVLDTLTSSDGYAGTGVSAWEGATVRVEGCAVEGSQGPGLIAEFEGSSMLVLDTVVRGSGEFGVQVTSGARFEAERCDVVGCRWVGVLGHDEGTALSLTDCSVQHTGLIGTDDGVGVAVWNGARLDMLGCELLDNLHAGVVLTNEGTVATVRDTTVAATGRTIGELGMTAVGLCAQQGARMLAERVTVQETQGPGLYTVDDESWLRCDDCSLPDNRFGGAVVVGDARLELESTTITGTLESVNLGGGVGVFAWEYEVMDPPSLELSDSVIHGNLVGAVYLDGEGSYEIRDSELSGSLGVEHGITARCGDGVYARDVAAWDGASGLLLEDNSITGNRGAGLFLDESWAALAGNDWAGNGPDLLVQGQACLEPLPAYAEAPDRIYCPEWDRPVCELDFRMNLGVADIDPVRLHSTGQVRVNTGRAGRHPRSMEQPELPSWSPR